MPAPRHSEIYKFLEAFRACVDNAEEIYTKGKCYEFHLIMKSIWSEAIPYTNGDHIISRIGNSYWDVTGKVLIKYEPMEES